MYAKCAIFYELGRKLVTNNMRNYSLIWYAWILSTGGKIGPYYFERVASQLLAGCIQAQLPSAWLRYHGCTHSFIDG